jgi:PAS domain S-box-containing protein
MPKNNIASAEQGRLEQELRKTKAHLNETQHIAKLGSWELDLITGYLSWSDEIFDMFEIDKSRFVATYEAFLDSIHPEDRDMVNHAYTSSLTTRTPYEVIHRLCMKDGRIRWVHERCISDFDTDGKPIRSVGTVQDITEQRLSILALRQSNRLLNAIVENIPVMIFMKRASDLRFELFNRAGEKLLGYSRNDMLGKSDYDFWPKEQADGFTAADRNALASEEITEILEEKISIANGEARYLSTWKIALHEESGEPTHLLGISIDITERKQIELDLQRARELLHRNVLVKEVHHRIKNSLQGVASLLRQQAEETPEASAALLKAIARVRSIAVVYGLQGEANSQVALCDLVRAICRNLQEETKQPLRVETAPHFKPVLLAETETVPIALIVNELLFNAVKHIGSEQADQAIHIIMQGSENEMNFIVYSVHGKLPQNFDFTEGRGLGTGLTLVKSLLPPTGANISIANAGGGVRAELRLTSPVLIHSTEPSEAP